MGAMRIDVPLGLALALLAALPAAAADKKDPVELFKKATGNDAEQLSSFLADHGTASVSAAALAGVSTSLTVVEDSKDFALLISPFTNSKGGGFVITPAKIRNPLPRIDLMTEYVQNGWWRALAGLNVSGAQGSVERGGTRYRLRGFALASNGYFDRNDDPIVYRATKTGAHSAADPTSCMGKYLAALGNQTGTETSDEGERPGAASAGAQNEFKACVAKIEAEAKRRWFVPRWSIALGTGDAERADGGDSTHTGALLALGASYGRGWGATKAAAPDDQPYGWALLTSARYARKQVVLSSIGTANLVRQNTSLVAVRAVAGTESWRFLAEASNNKAKQSDAGEVTLQRALGLDYRVAKDSWLNVRYGRRQKTSGTGEENAALVSVTLGGELLKF